MVEDRVLYVFEEDFREGTDFSNIQITDLKHSAKPAQIYSMVIFIDSEKKGHVLKSRNCIF